MADRMTLVLRNSPMDFTFFLRSVHMFGLCWGCATDVLRMTPVNKAPGRMVRCSIYSTRDRGTDLYDAANLVCDSKRARVLGASRR